ncbi:hypothetical protein LTR09_004887 [Extremus antarcticus]|uniref:Heterokaryon incompatibility domain-containing protein n=1 Tax=Extremus antarcticus TaxID=702011 RepID=A0AAJ0DQ39_9PEZI|nr:hypothetical protein LTR09_004887 [Extremus antarcticus]
MPNKNKGRLSDNPIRNPVERLPAALPQDPWGAEPSRVIHYGIVCKGPLCAGTFQPIRGVRYRCSQCTSNFCDQCVREPNDQHDETHVLLECPGLAEIEFEEKPASEMARLGDLDELDLIELEQISIGAAGDVVGSASIEAAKKHYRDSILGAKIKSGEIKRYDYHDSPLHPTEINPDEVGAVVRLLHLQPGKGEDALDCTFSQQALFKPSFYEALSCSWHKLLQKQVLTPEIPFVDGRGCLPPEEKVEAVYIGDSHFLEVSPELYAALRALRDPDDIKILWVDELCINRSLIPEKNFQTRAISLIYHHASNCVVWAGGDQEDVAIAFVLLEIVWHRCVEDLTSLPSPHDFNNDPEMPSLTSKDWQHAWRQLFQLFPRFILNKKCELHDAAFAKTATFQCGESTAHWPKAVAVARMLSQDSWTMAKSALGQD